MSVREAFDDPQWRKAARQTLAQPGGGPSIAVPFLASCGLIYTGMMWLLTGGEEGSLVLRIAGIPMMTLGGAALGWWWRSFTRKVAKRLPNGP